MKYANYFLLSLFALVAGLALSGCATTQSIAPVTASADSPKLLDAMLYAPNQAYVLMAKDGNYYFIPGKWYQFGAVVSSHNKIVKAFNKVDVWQEFASGSTITGTNTFEYDLSGIKNCCTRILAPWRRSTANDPGYYQTFTMWVVDENGRTSNSVTVGPIVIRGEGAPTIPKTW
jgi:hypothetical protein